MLSIAWKITLKLAWPDGWVGRRLITTASLRTFYINPTAAVKFGPVRFGAGFQLVRATVELQRQIGFGDQEGSVDLGAATWGVGGNVGFQLEAVKQYLSFGAHYRSPVKLSFDGDAHFANVPGALQSTIHDQSVSTSVIQPGSLAMGIATHPIKDLVIDFDAVWIHWNQFKSINLHFPNDASGSLDSVQRKDWSNTVNFHLGAEGNLGEHFQLRGGVLVDPTPSPANTLTPDIPDGTRINLALGGTWRHGSGVHVDLGSTLQFCAQVSAFVPVLFLDYRPAELKLPGLACEKGDLLALRFSDGSVESLSCMHTVEHVGLGRYGDPIDPTGDLKAMRELSRVLAVGGSLLFVVPVGRPRLQFNAHRIYSYDQVLAAFERLKLKEFTLIPDQGDLVENAPPALVAGQSWGCGCFWFTKE